MKAKHDSEGSAMNKCYDGIKLNIIVSKIFKTITKIPWLSF